MTLFGDAMGRAKRWIRPRVPIILQDEMAECGLAAIAMIASYHGQATTLRQMRQRCTVARDGMSLFQIIKVCEASGFACRPLKVMLDGLRQVRAPSILFWNKMHFVVLEAVDGRGLHIVDPALGRRFYTWEEALPLFSGVALELVPGLQFTLRRKSPTRQALGLGSVLAANPWLLRYLIPMGLLAIVMYLGAIAAPKLFSLTIDEVVAKNDADFLFLILYVFGAVFLLKSAAAWVRAWLDAQLRVALSQDLGIGVVAWLLRLPVDYFERRAPGDILRRTQVSDRAYIQFTAGWMDLAIDAFFGLAFLGLMALINLQLAALSLGLCALFFLFRLLTLPMMERTHKASIEAETARNVTLLGTLGAVESMKLYRYEGAKLACWSNQHVETEAARARVQRLQAMNGVVHEGLSHGHSLLVSALGAFAVLQGENSIGDLFAFVLYKDMFMGCTLKVLDRYANLRLLRVELSRVEDIVDEQPEVLDDNLYQARADQAAPILRSLQVRGGVFRYSSFERPVFADVDLHLAAGSKVAIFGPSGCGKSTLLKVLAGFYRLDGGQFEVNGIALQRFGLQRFRQQLAYVTAHDEIISASVTDNITLDSDRVDAAWLQSCVEQAGLLTAVQGLANGFNTKLGPAGVQLSTGQKQRLLIARALYRRPQMLLLDEPTSHLDADARDRIIATLEQLTTLCVIVTHDPEVAKACDRVLRMHAGQLRSIPAGESYG
ncbi:peptidase domain-containing ABC transporter [Pseudomonas sp. NPDC089752]|uniref:peptidase domain-containing ABC transporter n=1 Tax=Pseudomonas sp. NPDC089752 TaxID=3364472 RepID=UPI0037FACB78